MTPTNGTPLPSPDDDEQVWDEIEAKEDGGETVEVSVAELDELGEFLSALRTLTLSLEKRVTILEQVLAAMLGVSDEVEDNEGEGTGQSGPDGDSKPSIVDGSGNPIDAGGNEVSGDDS